MNEADDRERVV